MATEVIDLTSIPSTPDVIEILDDPPEPERTQDEPSRPDDDTVAESSRLDDAPKGPHSHASLNAGSQAQRRHGDTKRARSSQETNPTEEDEPRVRHERRKKRKKEKRKESDKTEEMFCIDTTPAEVKDPHPSSIEEKQPFPEVKFNVVDNLLLPAHVSLSVGDSGTLTGEDGEKILSPGSPDDSDFINVIGDETQKGVQRYFNESTASQGNLICKHCGVEGEHRTWDCSTKICLTCGARDEHLTRNCPISKTCFACGMRGHISRNCTQINSSSLPKGIHNCDRCGSRNHQENECPTHWRIYVYQSNSERDGILRARMKKSGMQLGHGGEGYIGEHDWCFNCGEEGHLGDDCRKLPRNYPKEPSAFSSYNRDSGPFDGTLQPREARRKRDWERDDMVLDGYGFSGPTNVGKRAKEKEKERARRRLQTREEEESWFDRRQGRKYYGGYD